MSGERPLPEWPDAVRTPHDDGWELDVTLRSKDAVKGLLKDPLKRKFLVQLCRAVHCTVVSVWFEDDGSFVWAHTARGRIAKDGGGRTMVGRTWAGFLRREGHWVPCV